MEDAAVSVVDVLEKARAARVEVSLDRGDLLLAAPSAPPPDLLRLLSRHKAEIVALLRRGGDSWSAGDWRAFFDDRLRAAERAGGLPRPEAEHCAFECCVAEWLNRNPAPSDPDRCAWCGREDRMGHAVLPFGTRDYGHTWLHPECWSPWYVQRRQEAAEHLAAMGIKRSSRATCRSALK
jgi:hypothetical protein